jgi:hypothetical protein
MTGLQEEVADVLGRYVAHWNAWEMDALKALWDADEEEPIYVAEETPALIGWEALGRYWQVSEPRRSEHYIGLSDLRVREIAPGVAHAFYTLSWNVYIYNNRLYPKPIGGTVRATTLLRRKPEGWRLFHHIEAPLASLIQLKDAHEKNVDPALFALLADKGIRFD